VKGPLVGANLYQILMTSLMLDTKNDRPGGRRNDRRRI
jgi:hypothetical protein